MWRDVGIVRDSPGGGINVLLMGMGWGSQEWVFTNIRFPGSHFMSWVLLALLFLSLVQAARGLTKAMSRCSLPKDEGKETSLQKLPRLQASVTVAQGRLRQQPKIETHGQRRRAREVCLCLGTS